MREPEGLSEEDEKAKPDIRPGSPRLQGSLGHQVKVP